MVSHILCQCYSSVMMKQVIRCLLMVLLSLPVFANTRANLATLVNGFQTYQAQFKEQTYGANKQLIQTSTGRVYIKRPGMFRWDVQTPNQQHIVTNGKTLWVYDVLLQQVTERSVTSAGSINPAALLSDNANQVLKQYRVSLQNKDGQVWYHLVPIAKQSTFTQINMQFSHKQLVAIHVINTLGQESDFRFSKITLNQPLNSDLFNFVPPKGVDVLKQ